MIWCYDERDLARELCVDKEIELYKLQRNYNELKEMLNDMKYLLVKRESEDYFDGTVLNNNNLPYVVMNDKITDWTMNIITDGDLTNVPNVDLFYDYFGKMNEFGLYGYNTQNSNLCGNKIENCYIKPRLIYDDGG